MPADLTAAIGEFEYAPWLVANLSLRGFPSERRGAPLSWDNVLYDSDALGYVVATHQHRSAYQAQTVFTWYHALSNGSPETERHRLLQTSWTTWAEQILGELCAEYPPTGDPTGPCFAGVTPWSDLGSASLGGEARRLYCKARIRVLFAHSDLSGYSIFEEANYRGVAAAEQALATLGIPFTTSIKT